MKACFIFNPNSGRNRRHPGMAAAIRQFISARGLDAELQITEGPGHATELARVAALTNHEVVVAIGGDGTMNEVAQGLLHTPSALALAPCGSGNGLALHLGLPREPLAALALATSTDNRIAAIDTGTVNERPFFNVMGLGLDADVSHRFNSLTNRGLPAYVRTALAALRDLRTYHCTIRTPGQAVAIGAVLISIANSDQYGNHALIAPRARVDDGHLDLVAVRAVGLAGTTVLAARLFLGTIDRSRHVLRLRGTHFEIERPAAGLIHTDGEPHREKSLLSIRVHPQSLRIVVPPRSRTAGAPPSGRSALLPLLRP